MKVTYILKNLADAFFTGREGAFAGLDSRSERERFTYLDKESRGDLRHCISQKIGNGSFRDKVDLNALLRSNVKMDYKIEARKGYKLVTFTIERA